MWRSMDAAVHEQVLPAKRAVLRDLPSEIVEIGPGRGSNFSLYPRGARVVAFEPNQYFDDDLREAAEEHGHELELRRDLLADRLPAANADVVVSTLVLCSVPDAPAMLDEIRRVLRPGGRLLFIEHVVAPQRGLRRAYQRLVRRPWRRLGDGCDTCARTAEHLAASQFELRDTELQTLGSNLDPTNLTMWGTAIRAG